MLTLYHNRRHYLVTTMDFRNQMPISVVEADNLFTKSIQFYYSIPSYQNQNSDLAEKDIKLVRNV
jgi:hypothetical protein